MYDNLSITHNFEWKNQEMISFENTKETHKYNQEFPSIHWKRDAELMELEIQHFVEFVWIRGKAEKWKSCSLGVSTRRKESRKRSGEAFQLVSFHIIIYIDVFYWVFEIEMKSLHNSLWNHFLCIFECFCIFSLFPNQEEDDLFIAKENSNNFIFLMWRIFMTCFHCCSSGEFPINRDKKDATIWKKTFNRLKTQNILK